MEAVPNGSERSETVSKASRGKVVGPKKVKNCLLVPLFKLVFGKDPINRKLKPLSQKSLQQIQDWQESLGIAGEGLLGSENFGGVVGVSCESRVIKSSESSVSQHC